MKRCTICKEYREESEFHKDASRYDGLSPKCKQCQRVMQCLYWENNKEKYRKGGEKYQARPGSRRAPGSLQRYKEQHREEVNAAAREYNRRHSEERKEYTKAYNEQNRDKYLAAKALQRAIRHAVLPPAKECICADCGNQAKHYHHESYAEQDRLNVVPLCSRCHKLRHMSKEIG